MGKKVLVVDDEPDVRTFLSTVLKREGYEVLVAEDGVEGYEVALRESPDLISLDLAMPQNSGTDFYRRLSKHERLMATPIIVVSGLAGRHLALRQPAAVFDKPIDPEAYIAAVERAIGPS
jgi:CheY-like chemotaxis protein